MFNIKDVIAARERIKDYIYATNLEYSYYFSQSAINTYLKLECRQKLNSFKIRGAANKILSLTEEERRKGLLAVSSGNYGIAVSYCAHILGDIPTKIIVPSVADPSKIDMIKRFNAEVIIGGKNYDEAFSYAMELKKKEDSIFLDPDSDLEIIAGQATIALEILEQNPEIDTIMAPIGGGALIAGIGMAAKSIKPSIKIIGVEPEASPTMKVSLRDNICYTQYDGEESICDPLVGGIAEVPFKMAPYCIDEILTVDDEMVKKAIIELASREKLIVEPSGAISVAAYMKNSEQFEGKNIAIILTGGNLDISLLYNILGEFKDTYYNN